jgi:hypothetical protein
MIGIDPLIKGLPIRSTYDVVVQGENHDDADSGHGLASSELTGSPIKIVLAILSQGEIIEMTLYQTLVLKFLEFSLSHQ